MRIVKNKGLICLSVIILMMLSVSCGFNFGYESGKQDARADDILELSTTQVEGIYVGDGWYYIMEIQCHTLNEEENRYYFGGINFRYNSDNENYERDRYISLLEMGEEYNKEINLIIDCFICKQFEDVISIEDLNDIELVLIDKKDIVELFNKTIQSEGYSIDKLNNSSFESYTSYNAKEKNIGNGQILRVGFYLMCDIKLVCIDIDYGNGSFLTQLIEDDNATEEQKELYNIFCRIKEKIIEENSLDIRHLFEKEEWYDKKVIQDILDVIDSFKAY